MKIWLVIYRSWNWDDCNSFSDEIIAARLFQGDAVAAANDHVRNWCDQVEWNFDNDSGKVGVVGELILKETELR